MDLRETGLVDPGRHWYYLSKYVAISRAARRSMSAATALVDVGAGSGYFASKLIEDGTVVSAWCVDPFYDEGQLGNRGSIHYVRSLSPEDSSRASLYLFIDVLEHVDDDRKLLRDYVAPAAKGTVLVITVPAFQSLWSGHDVFLGHRRRYRLSTVVALVQAEGLRVVERRYLFGVLLPVAWIRRRRANARESRSDLQPTSRWLNMLLRVVCSIEHRLPTNRLGGLSAMVVAIKD